MVLSEPTSSRRLWAGATISGFNLPSAVGPLLVLSYTVMSLPRSEIPPTVITLWAQPGANTVPYSAKPRDEPPFPADTTTTTPLSTASFARRLYVGE